MSSLSSSCEIKAAAFIILVRDLLFYFFEMPAPHVSLGVYLLKMPSCFPHLR
jgi:hypothetical protein